MCGIAGILGRVTPMKLRAMASAMSHRGPDGEGFFIDEQAGVGLAHRRLAIIDTSDRAAQPMTACNGRYRIVFNGEIYNFKALADELWAAGYRFNANSDTAVIAPLYDRHGIEGLRRLDGIFAFALWDGHERELVIVRDAMGVKPVYYGRSGSQIAFASELKALLGVVHDRVSVDTAALRDYLVRLWSPGDRTPLKHVRKLPPGHLIRASRRGFSVDRWYEPPIGRAQGRLHIGDAVREVREEFRRAVIDQCLSDVPIGAFLSGGVDSSAIVAAMVRSGHRPERAYCVGFAGPSMVDEGFGDDLAYARMMARRLDLRLEEIRVSAPEPEDLESLAWTLDEPQADPAALYVGGIAQAARSHGIKVLLSGAGGDDVFTGYRRHKAAALRARLGPVSRLVSGNNRIIGRLSGSLARRIGKLAYLLGGSDRDMLLRAFEFNRRSDAELCLSKDARASALADDGDALERAVDSTEGAPLVERMLHLEWHGFLPDHNLNYTDKAAMAHGVEVRVPFLANRLIEASSRIPWQFKTRSLDEKWILKKAVAEDVPAAILRRKKTGFGAPVRQWIMHGQLRAMAEDVLASRSFETRGLFDVGAARRVLADTIAGRRDGAYLVLALVMVEFWLRRFTDVNSAPVRQMVPN